MIAEVLELTGRLEVRALQKYNGIFSFFIGLYK